MTAFQKALKGLAALIKKPSLINHVLADDDLWTEHNLKIHQRQALPLVDLREICPDFSETIHHFAFLGGGSLPTDIGLLQALSRRFEKASYFEIGTWRGESALNLSKVAAECYTLNLSKAQLLEVGLSPRYADLIGYLSRKEPNIRHLEGDSMTFDFASLNKKFDLIFIDGNHRYDFVKNDTAKVFQHLIHENSIVVWHDYAYNPEQPRPEVLAGILDGSPAEYHSHLYHVSNTMCAVFIRENLEATRLQYPVIPDKTFEINLKIKPL